MKAGLRQALDDLANGRTTATELTQVALDRAKACRITLNAFSALAHDLALACAKDSDLRYSQGRQRPLEGLPIAIKDLIDTEGIETRYGSAAYVGHIPRADADIVQALAAQGAIIIGKTTTHEFAWGVTTASEAFGDTLNPLDSTRTPGGSSGGAAAAIGFGAVAGGVGTDTGGSVRIPAALCGLVGFKPSFGTWSTRGIFPLAPSLDHPGLLGAGVEDVIVLAEALGIDVGSAAERAGVRIGFIRDIAPIPLSHEVAASFDDALEHVRQAFACDTVASAGLFDGVFDAFAGIVLTEGGVTHFARSDPEWIASHYGLETASRIDRAKAVILGDYAQWQKTRRGFARKLGLMFSAIDFLMMPTTPCTAPRISEASVQIGDWAGTVREALMTYTAPFNVAGFPAISIPIASRNGGLPAALQIVAPPGKDAALLRMAGKMERLLSRPWRET